MTVELYQVDAFTDQPFRGNPAAVCLFERQQSDAWMQALAAEMNLSETAFLLPEGDGWRLRWFTPATEVDLCGHATLASACVLFHKHPEWQGQQLRFRTRSGVLLASWAAGRIELDFPVKPPTPITVPGGIAEALGFRPIEAVCSGDYFLFEAPDADLIAAAEPDFQRLKALPMPEVIITARSKDPAFDFISRFFAPQLGIDEDPVTGSAHCLLAPYWAEKLGKDCFTAYQASQRGGVLGLRLSGERVAITGAAVIVFQGHLMM